jgi:hypothetical protein
MKKTITLVSLLFALVLKAQLPTKTIVAIFDSATDYQEKVYFTIEKDKKKIAFSARGESNANGNAHYIGEFWNPDAIKKYSINGLPVSNHSNTNNVGKKYEIKYTSQELPSDDGVSILNTIVELKHATNVTASAPEKLTIPKDNFTAASSRIYEKKRVFIPGQGTTDKMEIKLVAIAEGQELFSINPQDKKWNEMKIQNGNELCKGATCVRVVINKEGFITLYRLPNTTDGKITGKIVGDKLIPCKKPEDLAKYKPEDFEKYWEFKFTGDKQKAALMIVAYDWFR